MPTGQGEPRRIALRGRGGGALSSTTNSGEDRGVARGHAADGAMRFSQHRY